MRKGTICQKHIEAQAGVRKIPISNTSLTGEVLGAEFESSLERDLILFAVWTYPLSWFQPQPVKIEYTDSQGRPRHYTPDLLLSFHPEFAPDRKPMLCEVKRREDLRANWPELKAKFRAARRLCRERGWEFRVFDEHRIRTARLRNIQFLWRYKHSPSYDELDEPIAEAMRHYDKTRLKDIIDNYFETPTQKGQAIWTFWGMVAHGWILFDMDEPITPDTLFWLADSRRHTYFAPARGPV
jgi:hypothetical protein